MNKTQIIQDNKEKFIVDYLKVTDKIDIIKAKLNFNDFDLLYKYPETKRKTLSEKLKYLENEKMWLQSRIDDCNKKIMECQS